MLHSRSWVRASLAIRSTLSFLFERWNLPGGAWAKHLNEGVGDGRWWSVMVGDGRWPIQHGKKIGDWKKMNLICFRFGNLWRFLCKRLMKLAATQGQFQHPKINPSMCRWRQSPFSDSHDLSTAPSPKSPSTSQRGANLQQLVGIRDHLFQLCLGHLG